MLKVHPKLMKRPTTKSSSKTAATYCVSVVSSGRVTYYAYAAVRPKRGPSVVAEDNSRDDFHAPPTFSWSADGDRADEAAITYSQGF